MLNECTGISHVDVQHIDNLIHRSQRRAKSRASALVSVRYRQNSIAEGLFSRRTTTAILDRSRANSHQKYSRRARENHRWVLLSGHGIRVAFRHYLLDSEGTLYRLPSAATQLSAPKNPPALPGQLCRSAAAQRGSRRGNDERSSDHRAALRIQ